ncbi:MAG: hypothetical protein P4L50_30215 [Anaerolineaceae bacterium]|nr:hypothetical protein [Anaerolineaceae bacterium]
MKQIRMHSRVLFLCIGTGLLALMMACQLTGGGNKTTTVPAANSAAQSSSETQANGTLNLPDPLVGLATLNSYQMNYASTVKGSQKGQAFESTLTITGMADGANKSELVQQTSSGIHPVYLNMVVFNGAEYTQQAAGGTCRSAATATAGPTLNLPPVFGAKQVGQETVNAVAANHYQFDEKAVAWQAGQSGKAQGDVWIAQQGGYVLKYQLSIQLPSNDFQGTRSWSYELSNINAGTQITLPQGCLPLISDIPMLDGATQVVQRPSFQEYTAGATLDQVSNFYKQKLTAAGWQLLPGVEPAGGQESMSFIQNQKDGSGRLAVIQMSEQNGQTAVIVQSAVTKKPIGMNATPVPGAKVTAESPTQASGTDNSSGTTESGVTLPKDLPKYPGATVGMQTDQMIMLKTGDTPEKVTAFYKQALTAAGYTAGNPMTMNGFNTQPWTKGQLQLMVVVMQQGGSTQIVITAGSK